MNETSYLEGEICDIYRDPETKQILEGKAKLIEFKEVGMPYINEDEGRQTKIYRNEKWLVEWIESNRHPTGSKSIRNIRYLFKIGLGGMGGYGEEVPEIPNDDDYYLS